MPTFFIDRCLGYETVPAALARAGASVERHDDHFKQDERDDVWLPEVGRRGWIVVSKDRRIRTRLAERQAVRNASVAVFILRGASLRAEEIAFALVKAYPAMLRMLQKQTRPFVAAVSTTGQVTVIDDFT